MSSVGVPQISEQLLTARVLDFIKREVYPAEQVLAGGGDVSDARLSELQARARDAGLWALPYGRDNGGQGLSLAEYASVAVAEGRSEWGSAVLGSAALLDAETLRWFAGPTLRERYSPGLVRGDERPCFSMTEPGVSGSDPRGMRTTATLDGEHWVIHGRKWFTSNARRATYALVLCRTEPDAPPREAFSAFLVPTTSRGYRVVRELPILGLMRDHCEVQYEGVRVPVDHLVGERGGGLAICSRRLALGRALRCLGWLGQADRAFDLMCQRLRERRLRDGTLGDHQLMQAHVFESYHDIVTTRALVMQIAADIDAAPPVLISTAKVAASRMLNRVLDRAVQVHGAEGLTDDGPLSGMFRLARAARIYDGPDEVHIASVGRTLLKEG